MRGRLQVNLSLNLSLNQGLNRTFKPSSESCSQPMAFAQIRRAWNTCKARRPHQTLQRPQKVPPSRTHFTGNRWSVAAQLSSAQAGLNSAFLQRHLGPTSPPLSCLTRSGNSCGFVCCLCGVRMYASMADGDGFLSFFLFNK